jgi:murein peptide amidase A
MPALLPCHSAHDYASLVTAWKRVARFAGMEMKNFSEAAGVPIFILENKAAASAQPAVYLSSGVHGDEPGAAWGLLEWARKNTALLRREAFVICPVLNPVGLKLNTRVDHRGLDLNRRFHLARDPLCGPWRKLVKPRRFTLSVCLHEDYDGQGTYIYELSNDATAQHSNAGLKACETVLPRDLRKLIDGHPAKKGVIRRGEIPAGFTGPEAIVLKELGCPITVTIETPSEFDLDHRVQGHRLCLEGMLEHHFKHCRA